MARVAGTNGDAYDYLNESIIQWPDQKRLSAWIREAGWAEVAYRNLTFASWPCTERASRSEPSGETVTSDEGRLGT